MRHLPIHNKYNRATQTGYIDLISNHVVDRFVTITDHNYIIIITILHATTINNNTNNNNNSNSNNSNDDIY